MNLNWSERGPGVSLRGRLRRPQQMSKRAPMRLKTKPYANNVKRLSNQHDSRPLFHQSPVQFLPATSSVAFVAFTRWRRRRCTPRTKAPRARALRAFRGATRSGARNSSKFGNLSAWEPSILFVVRCSSRVSAGNAPLPSARKNRPC
eukprot:scaffold3179_cov59-Phaeocystis_antarctica.AAC.8